MLTCRRGHPQKRVCSERLRPAPQKLFIYRVDFSSSVGRRNSTAAAMPHLSREVTPLTPRALLSSLSPCQICVENQSQKWPEDTTGRGGPEARGPFGLRNAPLRLLSRLLMPSEPRALTHWGVESLPPDSRPSSLHSASRGTKFPPWPGPRDCLSVSARPRAASRAADGACDCPGPRVGPPRAPPSKGPRPVHAQELPDGRPSLQALLGDASIPTRAQETHFSDPESTGSSPPSGTHLSAPAS